MEFRNLTAADVEVRVQSARQNEVALLLYKNARVDMNVLDETVGVENWQREHYECKGNLFCRVGINISADPNIDNWVWKSDCGAESNTEAEKGEASDSFKRACVNWGIGRELYTSPFIKIPASKCKIKDTGKKDKYGKQIYACYDKFQVEKIVIENKKIVGLSILNLSLPGEEPKKKRCFVWQSK